MNPLDLNSVTQYVEEYIGTFHSKRLSGLENLELRKILKRKNPYLFKAKNILTSQDLVKTFLDAHLSSQEETIFGDFLEGLAIFVCKQVRGGRKSSTTGIDLEFTSNGIHYIVAIKSGPNWGNSSQINKMKLDFKSAAKTLRTNNPKANVIAINGCCYGRTRKPDRGEYFKLCGQEFWEFISGDEHLYKEIIEPLGHKAKEKNEEFLKGYSQVINLFSREFMDDFCDDGIINWGKLVEFNSKRYSKNKLEII